jgi:CheY-like chemotaxis protein
VTGDCEAVSVQHGIQLIREQRPNLILLDIDRLDGDAQQLLDALCEPPGEQPVSIILLATEPPSRTLIEQKCIGGFVRKPFAIPTLLHQVQRALTAPPADR